MPHSAAFNLENFTPFLLNVAAETASLSFQRHYKVKYGMLRTEWRVLFHLGQFGPMYAKAICERARIHKTKVSRAVAALEAKRYLTRKEEARDRRQELLSLTQQGETVFRDLRREAQSFDDALMNRFDVEEQRVLKTVSVADCGVLIPDNAPQGLGWMREHSESCTRIRSARGY